MRILLVLFCSVLIYSTVFSQEMQISSSEKFNKRGFYKNSSASLDGNEIISDYDGNLMMTYSTNIDLPAGMSGDVSIMYNANVEHRAFWKLELNAPGYAINLPEWIIGFRGIAVQVLNFETNLFIEDAVDPNSNKNNFYGEEVPLLVTGYHYGNSLAPIPSYHFDVITILKADGSKIILQNSTPDARYGFYTEVGKGAKGVAYVLRIGTNDAIREIYYKPGDGSTFVFREEMTKYNEVDNVNYADPWYVPKALYLVEFHPNNYIWSKSITVTKDTTTRNDIVYSTNYLKFNYTDTTSHGLVTYGRKLFSGISWVIENTPRNQLDLDYYYDKINMNSITINNYNKNDKLLIRLNGQGQTSLFESTRDRAGSRIARITSIQDKLGRTDNFTYYPQQQYPVIEDNENKVLRIYRKNKNGWDQFYLYCQANLLQNITYFSKIISTFDYYNSTFDPNYPEIPKLDFSQTEQSIASNVDLAYRDCFTNFMLKKHEVYNSYQGSSALFKRKEYSYYVDDPYYQKRWTTDEIDSIKTKIQEYDGTGNLYRETVKNYSNYRCDFFDRNSLDRSFVLKLISEKVQGMSGSSDDNREINKKYTYDSGILVQYPGDTHFNYWPGTFDSRSVTETKRDLQHTGSSVKTTTITNTYQNATFYYNVSGVTKPFTIKLKASEKIKDGNSLWKYKKFQNFIPWGVFDDSYSGGTFKENNEYFYQVGLNEEEKDSSYSGTISYTKNEYNLGNFPGQLKKTTYNCQTSNKQSYTIYNYDGNETSMGLISSIENDKGVRQEYYYPKSYYDFNLGTFAYRDTAYGNIVQYNGTRTWSPFIQTDFQTKPFKTLTIYNNPLGIKDTLKTYSAYNPDGTLKFDIDANGNHSAFAYDAIGRLIAAALPMSFIDATTPFLLNSNTNFNDCYTSDNPTSKSFPMVIYKEYQNGGSTDPGTYSVSSKQAVSTTNNITSGKTVSTNSTWDPDPSYDRYNFFYCSLSNGIDRTKTILKATLKFSILCDENYPFNPMALDIHGISSSGASVGLIEGYSLPSDLGKEYREIEVDVTSIVKNTSFSKFKISVTPNSDPQNQSFLIKSQPISFITYNVPGAQPGVTIDKQPNITGSIVYYYDDANNTVTEKRRTSSDPSNLKEVVTKELLDGLGQVRADSMETDLKVNNRFVYELKGTNTYNSDGKVLTHTDGEGRTVTNSYDFLQRPIRQTNGDSTYKTTEYFVNPNTIANGSYSAKYSEYTVTTDEQRKPDRAVYTYYDNVGNKVAEKVGTNPTTIFQYDSLYRLSKVISPAQRVRTYSYDELGNLKQKDAPADEGTTLYKYDKYKRLRFTMNSAASAGERGITFTKYDQLGRVLATGTLSSTYGWSLLDADKDYSVNQNLTHFENYQSDTSNFVCVNMYDKYLKSGIFASMPDPFTWSQDDANSSRNLKGKLVLTAFRDKPGQGWNYRFYLYDYLGHVNHIFQKFGTSPWKLIAKGTNVLNNITTENVYNVEGGSLVIQHATWKNYDKQGRLTELRSDPTGNLNSSRQEATYTYNKADQCLTLTYNTVSNANKTTTYGYSQTRGWLNSIVNGNSNFYESLGYYGNGNIQTQTLINSVLGGTQTLTYNYDAMNRLTSVLQSGNPRESFQYDYDGNISQRNYLSGGTTKSLYFAPSGNRISSMFTETGTDEFFFYYDNRGNVTSDQYSGISNITYDHRNLPLSMAKSSVTSKYRYDDGGNRIFKDAQGKKEYYFRDDLGHELAIFDVTTDKLKTLNLYGNDLIGRIDRTWESEYDPWADEYYWSSYDNRFFYVKDHLGSIRQTLSESGVVQSAMDYYAFGGTMSSYVNGNTIDKYKFTGKERDTETGLDYFGARYFDSKYGRWVSVDPLDDLNPGISPYAYCHNDPINRIDPDGMDDEPNVLPTVVVTAKRQPQDLKQVTWFQMSIGLANNLVYMNQANQYEVYYGVPYLKISPNQNSNAVQGIVPLCIDGPSQMGNKFILNPKWKNWEQYMAKRGWKIGEIQETLKLGNKIPHPGQNFLNPGNKMVRIENPASGKSLIIDDVTKEIIQLGGKGFKY